MSDLTRVVYKYQIQPSSYATLHLPPPSKIVHFGRQGITFQVWVEHPMNADGTVPTSGTSTGSPPVADSARWCHHCREWGDHHTDRCPTHEVDTEEDLAVEFWGDAMRRDANRRAFWRGFQKGAGQAFAISLFLLGVAMFVLAVVLAYDWNLWALPSLLAGIGLAESGSWVWGEASRM